jgi:hypothetical protein
MFCYLLVSREIHCRECCKRRRTKRRMEVEYKGEVDVKDEAYQKEDGGGHDKEDEVYEEEDGG